MKKYLLYIILFTLGLGSCKKDNDKPIIGDVDERLSAVLAEYSKQLTDAEFGWKGYLLTDNQTSATFLFKFDKKNRTVMAADYEEEPAESSYRLKALQRPTILFDTYSTLHLIADPNSNVIGGTTGMGYYSDFEFAFMSSSADTIHLEGLLNKSKLLLIRSKSKAESERVFSALSDVSEAAAKIKTYFKRTTIDGVECEVKLDGASQIFSLSYLEDGSLKTVSTYYYVSGTSVTFYTPLQIGKTTIKEITDVGFDTGTSSLKAKINGVQISIKEALVPMKMDMTAAQRWYDQKAVNQNDCWVSDKAFHAEGVDDFCNFKSVPNFQTLWYAGSSVFGGAPYDGMIAMTTSLMAPYTASKMPIDVKDGKAKFTLIGSAGTFTGTSPIAKAMSAARTILYGGAIPGSSEEWYLIPTSNDGKRYDMVRAKDAQAWISWRPR
ncbi:DUF4302 domain-containing protein [Sphingobacterium detergens]